MIGFPAAHTFNKRKAEGKDKRVQLSDAFDAVLGERLLPLYDVLEDERQEEPAAEDPKPEVDHATLVERLKSEFDAEEVG